MTHSPLPFGHRRSVQSCGVVSDLCGVALVLTALCMTDTIGGGGADTGANATPIAARKVPTPLPSHPGNVYLAGEEVTIPLPSNLIGQAETWRLVDDSGRKLAAGTCPPGGAATARVTLGKLGVGWYRIDFHASGGEYSGWTSAAVLAPLKAPTPPDSPVCVDVAAAWFARAYGAGQEGHQAYYANLAALAGANWVRDRITWSEIETAPGVLAPETDYDRSAATQAAAGLTVLQVLHATPPWATDAVRDGAEAGKRFPRDLWHMYRFCQEMAPRFQGRVQAWEPWNEANIDVFGGHTTTEMCTLQKAAFLGSKAGAPQVTVCWNVFAGAGSAAQTRNVLANEAWPYFDTYNIHTYDQPTAYLGLFGTAREAACGRPLWLSECGIYQPWQTARPWGELTPELELTQARFVAKSYASSLYAGVSRHFIFILGNYVENQAQLGLMRHDHTPRPGYVALAAVGRLLAGARCLGRLPPTAGDSPRVYAFDVALGGQPKVVLVAWSDSGQPWPGPLPPHIEAVADYLGRDLGTAIPPTLGPAAVFVVLSAEAGRALKLAPPPAAAPRRDGAPSPVVLQLNEPHTAINLSADAYTRRAGETAALEIVVYNFASHPVAGSLSAEVLPVGWLLKPPSWRVELAAQERRVLSGQLTLPAGGRTLLDGNAVKLRGEFGADGRPVLAFNVVTPLADLTPALTQPLASASLPDKWQDNIDPQASMTHQAVGTVGMRFDMQFGAGDPWGYPILTLAADERPADNLDGLACTIQLLEGEGQLNVQFTEENGASYITAVPVNAALRTPQRAVCRFSGVSWGPWSKPDPDGGLQPSRIRQVMVGINSKSNTTVKLVVSDLAWVRF